MGPTLRDRASFVAAVIVGAIFLVAGLWYVQLLDPLVDADLLVFLTAAFLLTSIAGARAYLLNHHPLDPSRPSTPVIVGLVHELAARTGTSAPRVAMDDSRQGRAIANVGAVEMGPGSQTILVTEQLVADLEAGRFEVPSLRGVILHELGHLALEHSYLRLWTGIGERLIRVAAAVSVVVLLVSSAARRTVLGEPELLIAIAVGPFVVASVQAVVQRAQEAQADAFAVRHAAGRELISFLRWMSVDLAPILRLDRAGIPADPLLRKEIRVGLLRLISEAEAAGDQERTEFMREALRRLDERELEDQPGVGELPRLALMVRRLMRGLALAWLGVVRWNRTHPPVDERLARIAAELGESAASPQGRPAP